MMLKWTCGRLELFSMVHKYSLKITLTEHALSLKQWSLSLVPSPHLAFHRLQYSKAGRAWYISSRE